MKTVFLATGTNIGNRVANLQSAIQQIEKQIGTIVQQSSVYETEAWGGVVQASFFNQVLELRTNLSASQVLDCCLEIEQGMGRERKIRWGPRLIDIDLLFYDKELIEEGPRLIVPHPRMHLRNFVLLPFCEIAADWEHPQLKKKMKKILKDCNDVLPAIKRK